VSRNTGSVNGPAGRSAGSVSAPPPAAGGAGTGTGMGTISRYSSYEVKHLPATGTVSFAGHHHSSAHVGHLPPLPPPSPQLQTPYAVRPRVTSWYSKNHHLIRSRSLVAITLVVGILGALIFAAVANSQGSGPCVDVNPFWPLLQILFCAITTFIQIICILVISHKLRRHDRDSLGIKRELSGVATIMIVFCCIGLPAVLAVSSDGLLGDEWSIAMIVGSLMSWSMTMPVCFSFIFQPTSSFFLS
jgi:hypothetical protein